TFDDTSQCDREREAHLHNLLETCASTGMVHVVIIIPTRLCRRSSKRELTLENDARREWERMSLQHAPTIATSPPALFTSLFAGLICGPSTSRVAAVSEFCERRSNVRRYDATRFAIAWDEDVAAAILYVIKRGLSGHFRVTADGDVDQIELARALGPRHTESS